MASTVSAAQLIANGVSPSYAPSLASQINTLDPSVRDRFTATVVDFYQTYGAQGYDLDINQAARSVATQKAIDATGVKAASPRNSWHVGGGAADFTVYKDGKRDYGTKSGNAYQALLSPIAQRNGLNNPIRNDVGHFQPKEVSLARHGQSVAAAVDPNLKTSISLAGRGDVAPSNVPNPVLRPDTAFASLTGTLPLTLASYVPPATLAPAQQAALEEAAGKPPTVAPNLVDETVGLPPRQMVSAEVLEPVDLPRGAPYGADNLIRAMMNNDPQGLRAAMLNVITQATIDPQGRGLQPVKDYISGVVQNAAGALRYASQNYASNPILRAATGIWQGAIDAALKSSPFPARATADVPLPMPRPAMNPQPVAVASNAPTIPSLDIPTRTPESWASGMDQYRPATPSVSSTSERASDASSDRSPAAWAQGIAEYRPATAVQATPAPQSSTSRYTDSIAQYRPATPPPAQQSYPDRELRAAPAPLEVPEPNLATPLTRSAASWAQGMDQYRSASPAARAAAPAAPAPTPQPILAPDAYAALTGGKPMTANGFLAGQGMLMRTPNAPPPPPVPQVTVRAQPRPAVRPAAPRPATSIAAPRAPMSGLPSLPALLSGQRFTNTTGAPIVLPPSPNSHGGPVSVPPGATYTPANFDPVSGGSTYDYVTTPNGTTSYTTSGGTTWTIDTNNQGPGSATASKVLCTWFCRKGWLPKNVWKADIRYSMTMVDPAVQSGYLLWAAPLVRWLERETLAGKLVAAMIFPVVRGWAHEMAHRADPAQFPKGSVMGKAVMATCAPLCRLVGMTVARIRQKSVEAF